MLLVCRECFKILEGVICYDIRDSWEITLHGIPLQCNSCGGHIVEIDELIYETIYVLNSRGYKTEFCCSGHTYFNDKDSPYIMFKDKLPIKNKHFMESFNRYLKHYFNIEGDYIIRIKYDDDSLDFIWNDIIEKRQHINFLNLQLLKFAKSLKRKKW